jgi:ureidoglycolate hydrolase
VIAEPLTSDAFRPSGRVLTRPQAAPDAPAGFRAFRVAPGSGVLLDPGVWHGAPLAIDRPLAAVVLLPHRTGTEDTVVTRFPDNPITIEV